MFWWDELIIPCIYSCKDDLELETRVLIYSKYEKYYYKPKIYAMLQKILSNVTLFISNFSHRCHIFM